MTIEERVDELETEVADLQTTVASLQTTVTTLISNLGLNNTDLNETLELIANKSGDGEVQNRVQAWIASTCPRDPPGCH
jgi:hypothetical protein